jgi:hypothetical protein
MESELRYRTGELEPPSPQRPLPPQRSSPWDRLLGLQQRAGNTATAALVGSIQRKLLVGSVDDPAEREADEVAAQVAAAVQGRQGGAAAHDQPCGAGEQIDEAATALQRHGAPGMPERGAPVMSDQLDGSGPARRRPAAVLRRPGPGALADLDGHGPAGGDAHPQVAAGIAAERSGGSPLSAGVRRPFEQAFGADLGSVRIHTGAKADRLSRSLNAQAFTTGSDIFFTKGAFNPGTSSGTELLAHELTHVVQQGAASSPSAVRRKGGKDAVDAKPEAKGVGSLTRALEKAVDKNVKGWNGKSTDAQDAVSPAAKALFDKDPEYFCDLVVYKISKHGAESLKARLLSLSSPPASRWRTFEVAWKQQKAEVVAILAGGAWKHHREDVEELGMKNPDFFITNVLLDGLRRSDWGKQSLQQLVEDRELLGELSSAAPASYARLVAQIPVLKLVTGVQSRLAHAEGKGVTVTQEMAIDELFDSFISNKGMEVGYSGTKVDDNLVMLTGQTKKDKESREKDLKPLMPDLPAKLSTACHQLLQLFKSVLSSYPGLEELKAENGSEDMAVLTKPLRTLPGGLIANTYAGNVFDAEGRPTGQIFFSGDRAKISKSHSWVVLDGVAYDPVLGTKGDSVTDFGGKFEFRSGPDVATEVGGRRRRTLTQDKTLVVGTAYGITTGWRLG